MRSTHSTAGFPHNRAGGGRLRATTARRKAVSKVLGQQCLHENSRLLYSPCARGGISGARAGAKPSGSPNSESRNAAAIRSDASADGSNPHARAVADARRADARASSIARHDCGRTRNVRHAGLSRRGFASRRGAVVIRETSDPQRAANCARQDALADANHASADVAKRWATGTRRTDDDGAARRTTARWTRRSA